MLSVLKEAFMSTSKRRTAELTAGNARSTAELIALIGDPSKPDPRDGERIETAPALDIKTELA